jgi:hypothetical protein
MGHSKDKLDPDYFILAIIPWSLQIAAINLLETFSTVSTWNVYYSNFMDLRFHCSYIIIGIV